MPNFIQISPNSTGLKIDTSELVVGTNTVERQNVCVSDPALATGATNVVTKGSQGAIASATQDLKDSGRTPVCFSSYNNLTNGAYWGLNSTETMLSMALSKLGIAQTGVTSYTVTAGKTLRLQSFVFWTFESPINGTEFNLRAASTGTVSITSNILLSFPMVPGTGWLTAPSITIPDGFEIPGGTSIGVSGLIYNSGSSSIYGTIIGYEY
jgi:hypothetical protein